MLILAASTTRADSISVVSGTPGSSNYLNVSGTITAGNGTVTITLLNNLTNAQVVSIGQNISAVYFQVSGYGGFATLSSSNSTQSAVVLKTGHLLGSLSSTGWTTQNNVTGGLAVCVICPVTNAPAGPRLTILGGTGSGAYANANGSISKNLPHNPYLVGTVTFILNVPGVTPTSTFSNVIVQFGTTATPPTAVPEPGSWALMLLSGAAIVGGLVIRRRNLSVPT
jgi:hypothetical protein